MRPRRRDSDRARGRPEFRSPPDATPSRRVASEEARRRFARELLHSRLGGMESHLEEIETQAFLARDHYLAVEDAFIRKLRLERREKLREVAVERLLVAALDEDI